jgi:hypothetical protein
MTAKIRIATVAKKCSIKPPYRLIASSAIALCFLSLSNAYGAGNTTLRTPTVNDATSEPYNLNIDAPILIVFGQSNAVGWLATMPDNSEDIKNCTNMPNVFGLSRELNRSPYYGNVSWSNYSCSGFNLGQEYNAGKTYHLAGNFARGWQSAIKSGTKLPNLYVIHIGWGGQGFMEADEKSKNGRWLDTRSPRDVESLYPLAINKLKLAIKDLRASGKRPRIIGLHWNQWETEADNRTMLSTHDAQIKFNNYLNGFRSALGGTTFPIYLYYPRSTAYNKTSTDYIRQAFLNMVVDENNNFQMLDAADSVKPSGEALFDPNISTRYGIMNDPYHYNKDVQLWFAQKQLDAVLKDKNYGVPVSGTIETANIPKIAERNDHTGDGKLDAIFTNDAGQYQLWGFNGLKKDVDKRLPFSLDSSWRVVVRGDVDGDGSSDLVFHRVGTTEYKIAFIGGPSISVNDMTVPAAGYEIIGSGDFDGDGKADLLWRNINSGALVVWYMNGANKKGSVTLGTPSLPASAGWSLAAVADFDGNGVADILWKNSNDASLNLWKLGSSGTVSSTQITMQRPSADADIVGVADFNGDGLTDLLWSTPDGSSNTVMMMNGSTVAKKVSLETPSKGWLPALFGDLDGDGKADILWKNPSSSGWAAWILNGNPRQVSGAYLGVSANGWHLIQ